MNGLDITKTGQTRANYFQEYFVDGSGNKFMLLLYHDNKKGTQLFTSSNCTNNLQYGLYSRLYLLESAPEAFKDGKQVLFFKNAYNLDLKKLDYKKFANSLSLTNAFIIAVTVTIIELINKSLTLKLLVGFIVLIPLILISYYFLGKIYKKKEGN